jgi:hypothetical protein
MPTLTPLSFQWWLMARRKEKRVVANVEERGKRFVVFMLYYTLEWFAYFVYFKFLD